MFVYHVSYFIEYGLCVIDLWYLKSLNIAFFEKYWSFTWFTERYLSNSMREESLTKLAKEGYCFVPKESKLAYFTGFKVDGTVLNGTKPEKSFKWDIFKSLESLLERGSLRCLPNSKNQVFPAPFAQNHPMFIFEFADSLMMHWTLLVYSLQLASYFRENVYDDRNLSF